MIQNYSILAIIAFGIMAVTSPGAGYLLGLSRVRNRSVEMLEYYKSEQRTMLTSYYRIVAIASVVELIGASLLYVNPNFIAAIAILIAIITPAGIVLITMIPVGLSIGVALTLASSEPMPGCCANCDYDLRGSPNGLCPECGHAGSVTRSVQQS